MLAGMFPDSMPTARQLQAHARRVGLDFVEQPDGLAKLTILTGVIACQQRLMQQYLEAAGASWEKHEDAKAAFADSLGMQSGREYRVLLACRGVYEQEFIAGLGSILVDDTMQKSLDESQHTASMCSLCFRLVSCAAGLCHELLIARRRRYPFRLFAAAASLGDLTLEGLEEERPCLMDPWSRAVLAHYKGRLGSDEARADVLSTASQVCVDTAQIEARHSGIRRRVVKASVQTHVQQVQHASADFCLAFLSRERQRLQHLVPAIGGGPDQPGGAGADASERKRKRGGGGPWRAFVHQECAGNRKADLGQLATEYKALEEGRMAELVALGECGTRAHRAGHSAFGPTAREADRARQKRLRAREDEEASAVAKTVLRQACGAEASIAKGAASLALLPASSTVDAPLALGSWEEYLAQTKALAKGLDAARKAIEKEGAAALARWAQAQTELGARPLSGVVSTSQAAGFVAQPPRDSTFRSWQWRPVDTTAAATRAVSVDGQRSIGQSLRAALEQDWRGHHKMVCHDDVESISDKKVPSVCFDAGVCLCTGSGRALRLLANKFIQVAKDICPASSALRVDLVECKLAYLLTGVSPTEPPQHGQACTPPLPAVDFQTLVLLHVAAQSLSPFRPTFQRMVLNDLVAGKASAQAALEWLTLHEALQGLDRELRWTLRLFRLVDSQAPVADFRADRQEYLEIALVMPEVPFWSGPADCRRSSTYRFPSDQRKDDTDEEDQGAAGDNKEDEPGGVDSESEGASDMDPWARSDIEEAGPPGGGGMEEAPAGSQEASQVGQVANAGDAADSREEMAPPPQDEGGRRRRRTEPDVIFSVPGGEIRYYSGIRRFAAWCHIEAHGRRCRREKVAYGGRHGAQGRPLGFLMAWLATGENYEGQAEHMGYEIAIGFEARRVGRATLADIGGSEMLFAHERPAREGEDEPFEHP